MAFEWLAAIFSGKRIHFTFDNRKQAGNDINTNTQRQKRTSKIDNSTKNKTKTINKGPVTYIQGDVNLSVKIQLGPDGSIPNEAIRQLTPVVEQFEQKNLALLAVDSTDIVKDIKSFEDTSEVRGLLKFFKHRLKTNDFLRMRMGLYIKHLNETERFSQANIYWRQVTIGQRQRDRRIIELASAGYFSTFFRPLYKYLEKSNSNTAQKRFGKELESILEDMRFAIFVSSGLKVNEIADKVIKQAVSNIKYGVKADVISLHAAGKQQVTRVRQAVQLLRSEFPVIKINTQPKNTEILRVDIDYRKHNLDESLLQDDVLFPDI